MSGLRKLGIKNSLVLFAEPGKSLDDGDISCGENSDSHFLHLFYDVIGFKSLASFFLSPEQFDEWIEAETYSS